MSATAARIGFITSQYRLATAGPDQDVIDKYGEAARDTLDPIETFFDDVDDAATMAAERLTLLSPDRRRFPVSASGILGLPGDLAVTPTTSSVHLIDDERSADFNGAAVEIGVDFERDQTTFIVWG